MLGPAWAFKKGISCFEPLDDAGAGFLPVRFEFKKPFLNGSVNGLMPSRLRVVASIVFLGIGAEEEGGGGLLRRDMEATSSDMSSKGGSSSSASG
jgi:hypothetical protein